MTMMYTKHFPGGPAVSGLLSCLFVTMEYLIHPFSWFASQFISLFIPTTSELEKPYFVIVKVVFLFVPYLLASVLFFPLYAIGVLARVPLQHVRAPYIISEKWTPYSRRKYQKRRACDQYTILTANLCLLPEFLARFNNLSRTASRATEIGQRIIVDQLLHDQNHAREAELPIPLTRLLERHRLEHKRVLNYSANNSNKGVPAGMSPAISSITSSLLVSSTLAHFTQLDFLCFQECWSTTLTQRLVRELQQLYPYIVHDIGAYDFDVNCYGFNSGLMFASKYCIGDVDFKPFTGELTRGAFDSKGLLMVKINKQHVGYIFLTHLEAFEGKKKIREKQMTSIMSWMHDFKKSNKELHDVILFDFLCGDFNFDNMSPCDKSCQHHALFDKYEDVARERPGVDKAWSIGTKLRQLSLYEEAVSSPEVMQRTLQSPLKRPLYVVDATLVKGSYGEIRAQQPRLDGRGKPLITPRSGKRRTNYILCRHNIPVIVENYNFITRLATLTDHVPISMTIKVHA
ncbi:sphingomyelin phosphodiesterase 3-like isoform X2 [Gigantopelta aegis]|uniref:sphingomyelin phosphodiesterase 3-like isoform X2 n=1 Tax=Gigantopelta aegis TaxID=1735272 RepID=UPI001B88BD14|nr:sphingomyelin phosphodiesterase 3-like isoform X2 [Gigantopelta aegis]